MGARLVLELQKPPRHLVLGVALGPALPLRSLPTSLLRLPATTSQVVVGELAPHHSFI
jgi:hypothetical protein